MGKVVCYLLVFLWVVSYSDPVQSDSSTAPFVLKISEELFLDKQSYVIGSVLAKNIAIGSHSTISGLLMSDSLLVVHDSVVISGEMVFNGLLQVGKGGAIYGPLKNGPVEITPINFNSPQYKPSKSYTLAPAKKGALEPGIYGDVLVGASSRLSLYPGEYTFRSLVIEKSGTLVLDEDGIGVNLWIINDFQMRSQARVLNLGNNRNSTITVVGNGGVSIGSGATVQSMLRILNGPITTSGSVHIEAPIEAKRAKFGRGTSIGLHQGIELTDLFDKDLIRADGSPTNVFVASEFYQAGFRYFNAAPPQSNSTNRWDEIKGHVAAALKEGDDGSVIPIITVNNVYRAHEKNGTTTIRPFKIIAFAVDTVYSNSVLFLTPSNLSLSLEGTVTSFNLRLGTQSWSLPPDSRLEAQLDVKSGTASFYVEAVYNNGTIIGNMCNIFIKDLFASSEQPLTQSSTALPAAGSLDAESQPHGP